MWNLDKLKLGKGRLWVFTFSLLAIGTNSVYGNRLSLEEAYHEALKQQTVEGTVVDASTGQGISGVTITLKGSTVSTQTDSQGKFSLQARNGDILVTNILGFQSEERTVTGTTITFRLITEQADIEEVVVVGYGTMRKSDVTGSISVVKGEEMTKAQNFGALDNLRGKAAGVNIFSNSGQPGAYGAKVLIRGNATINASSSPLYVVDGVVMENFHLMNPNDIERIEVLKDASSAAIYGARGANGVILVTTKRGASGGGKSISYQGSVGVSSVQRYMNVLNSQQWVDAFMIGLANENKYQADFLKNRDPNWTPWSLDKKDWFNDPNYFDSNGNPLYDTNWQKESSRNGLSHNHQINIQQGDEKSSVGAFLNYTDQQGVIKNMFSKRVSGKLAYDTKAVDWLSSNVNLMVNHSLANFTPEDGGGQDARRTMIEMLPWLPVYEPSGQYTSSTSSTINNVLGFEGMANPVSILELQKRNRYNTQIFGNAALTFHLAEGLDLRTQFGVDNQRRDYKGYSSVLLNNISKPNGWAEMQYENVFYWQQENYLTYQKTIDKHRVNLMGGLSWQARTSQYSQSRTEGFDDDFYEWNNMGVGRTPSSPNSNTDKWAMNSYFVRGAYTYNDKYSATVTGRYDGSSKFGKNNKYAFFPSAGLAWNVSNEDFMADNITVSNLKVHTSYGRTGNSEIGSYSSTANVSAGTTLLDGGRQPFSWVSSLANPDLRWETSDQFDFGVEIGLFSNRLNFDVSVYNKKTKDLLLQTPIPRSTGYSSVMKNIGSVQNRGVELLINAYPIKNENLTWNTMLNMSYNQNKVLKLGDKDEDIQRLWWVGGANQIIRVGENLNSFYGYKREGIYTQADVDAGQATLSQVGRPKRSADKYIIGKGTPDWAGSFINTLNYKDFDLTVDLQFVYGVETMQQFYHSTYDRFGITNGLVEILTDAYSESNPNTRQQAIYLTNSGHAGQDTNVDDAWVVNGSYLRFNLIQLGYTFNSEMLNKLRLGGIRIFASANNPWLITSKDFKGYDPESTSQVGDNFGQNITFFSYPRAKTFTLGVNVKF
ncbi:SusC/RagA family TonB-linked outer membrane protein [Sphingobacterium cavernae]|uniref:SusC/RagA family TonB-linked outer membrane protein n=1 Tax=Sphingobacterium cavernae TaxID=2592657 RepID=UPI0012300CD2|nr:TonB-dependent receptor [Sphingobacterium cavernae]